MNRIKISEETFLSTLTEAIYLWLIVGRCMLSLLFEIACQKVLEDTKYVNIGLNDNNFFQIRMSF